MLANFEFLFFLCFALAAAWMLATVMLSSNLRQRHQDVYEDLKLEGLWPRTISGWIGQFNNTESVMNMLTFVLSGRYKDLNDQNLNHLAGLMRLIFIVFILSFSAAAYLIVFDQDTHKNSRIENSLNVSDMTPIQQAYEFYRQKQWPEAIDRFDQHLLFSDNDAEALYWRGLAHWQMKNEPLALADFRRALKLAPKNFDAAQNTDRILSHQKRWNEVIELWDRFINYSPAHADAYLERGGAYHHMGDAEKARQNAVKACELGSTTACRYAK